jgi:putative glutamine amidotransferase
VRVRRSPGKLGKPQIGIPTGYEESTGRYLLDRRYVGAVERSGGVPILIPVPAASDSVSDLARQLDGLLLPGSPTDIDPSRYGEAPHPRLGRPFRERDEADFLLLELASERGLPVLGICHGMQTLNVWRGGSLIQDIPSEIGDGLPHQNPGRPRDAPAHGIRIQAGSRLGDIYPDGVEVTSFHHQSVRRPGTGLSVVARAPDGIIEAIEGTEDSFVIGVQWHPEAEWERSEPARKLFASLIRAADAGID